jgi:Spy/CpxP family protein refolding chaperone
MKIKKNFRLLPLAILTLGAISLTVPSVFAEPATDAQKQERRERRQGGAMKVYDQLNLTADQSAALKPVLENVRAQMKALRENKELEPKQRREQMKQIRTDSDTKINAILTEEQRTKLAELRAQQRANRPKRNKEAAPAA